MFRKPGIWPLPPPLAAGAGLRGVFEESRGPPAMMSAHCVISQFGFLFGRRVSASLSLSCFSSVFSFPPAPSLIDWPGNPPLSGPGEITQSLEGVTWNYPPGNRNLLVTLSRQRKPLLYTPGRVEEASVTLPGPRLRKITQWAPRPASAGSRLRPGPGGVRFSPTRSERRKRQDTPGRGCSLTSGALPMEEGDNRWRFCPENIGNFVFVFRIWG